MAQFVEIVPNSTFDDLFLEGAEEALGDAIGLRFPDESKAMMNAEIAQFISEVVGSVLASVIAADGQASSLIRSERSEVLLDAHSNRFEGGEAISLFADMPSDAFRIEMVDYSENPDIAFFDRHDLGSIGSPHLIGTIRANGSIVGVCLSSWYPERRQQVVLAHDPQDAVVTNM